MGPKKDSSGESKKGSPTNPKKGSPKTKPVKPPEPRKKSTSKKSASTSAAFSEQKKTKKQEEKKENDLNEDDNDDNDDNDNISVTSSQLFGSNGTFSGDDSEKDSDFSSDDEAPTNSNQRRKTPGFVFTNNNSDDEEDNISVETEDEDEDEDYNEEDDSDGELEDDLVLSEDDEGQINNDEHDHPTRKSRISASMIDTAVLATSASLGNMDDPNIASPENFEQSDDEFDDENDDFDRPIIERDDRYFDKLTDRLRQNLISDFHPHLLPHDRETVLKLSKVVRDEEGEIIDANHTTFPWLSNFELTRVLGERAEQLDDGALAFIDVPEGVIEGSKIARIELQEGKLPFVIVRPLPSGKVEYWPLNELQFIPVCDINAL